MIFAIDLKFSGHFYEKNFLPPLAPYLVWPTL
jgi:hypothetical protein